MTLSSKETIFVLTGDFVDSMSLPDGVLDTAMRQISETIGSFAGDKRPQFARNRGDGWQAVVPANAQPLRLTLAIVAALKAQGPRIATRVAIAGGTPPRTLSSDLNSVMAPVFAASGRALDQLQGDRQITFADDPKLDACARLVDAITQTWTVAKGKTALHLLHPDRPTRAEVAERLGISRQAVDKSAHGAQLPAIIDALDMIEASQ